MNLTDSTLRKEMNLARTPIEKTRRLNSRRSSIGASALSSHQMKPTRSDTNATEAAASIRWSSRGGTFRASL